MNLWFRTLLTFILSFRKPRLDVLDTGRMRLTCWPTDLDIALHMNNGRYLTIADLGRWELITRTGFWTVMRRNGWHPVVGTSKIWHRRSLEPFQRFELTTQMIGWDAKWVYIEHNFLGTGDKAGTLYCRIVVKTLFLKGREKVPTAELIAAFGHVGESPELEPGLAAMLA